MRKIGAVTIGQSPRSDVTKDILPLLNNFDLVECGALDDYTYEEVINEFQPKDENLFVSRMRDGKQVFLSKKKIISQLNSCIERLEQIGCEVIMVFCTGKIDGLKSKVKLLQPNVIMHKIIPSIAINTKMAIIIPDKKQKQQIRKQWEYVDLDITIFSASPYEDIEKIQILSKKIEKQNFGLVYLDCIGYSKQMQEIVSELTCVPVLLPRTILAEVANLI